MAISLVDPTIRILSTTDVVSQQRELVRDAIRNPDPSSLFRHLPLELLDAIAELEGGRMTKGEAKQYRVQLLKESDEFYDTRPEY